MNLQTSSDSQGHRRLPTIRVNSNTTSIDDEYLSRSEFGTAQLRHHAMIGVTESVSHESLVQREAFTLFYETLLLVYLAVSLFGTSSLANKECPLRPEIRLTRFLELVLIPTVVARYAVYYLTRNEVVDQRM